MIYQHTLNIPASTLISAPVSEIMEVNKGFVYQVSAIIPSGCVGLSGIRVLDGLHNVYPSTPNEWFIGDGVVHNFNDSYMKINAPYHFVIEGYNLDDTYEHNLTIMIGMEIQEIFIARFLPSYTYDKIIEMLKLINQTDNTDLDTIINDAFSWTTGD